MNCNNDNSNNNVEVRNFISMNEEMGQSDSPQGLNPRDIYRYYQYDRRFSGRGKTIALIDAYYYENAREDLDKFSETFNLPKANLIIAYPQGRPEDINSEWAMESALDLQWAHAMAPRARLMLVSAKSSSVDDLFGAVRYAIENGADIVSMSWGMEEFNREEELDYYFRLSDRTVFVASSGDFGGKALYPSVSQYVISVGGTELKINSEGRLIEEIAWSGSGGGPSRYIELPWWQRRFGVGRRFGNNRTTPDVAFNASPDSGVSVYLTDPESEESNWIVVGGTSLATANWAGIIASLNIDRRYLSRLIYELAGTTSYTNPYRAYKDIVRGRAGRYSAREGYDLITGLGVPRIRNIADAMEEREEDR